MLSSGLAHAFWCSEPLLFSHLVKQGAVVPWDGLRGRHARASGFYLRRPGGHCHQPSANNYPSTPSALCDWYMAVQPLGRDPATVTLLPAPHKRATRVSLHTQATPPPTELNGSSPPAVQHFSPMTLCWQGSWQGPRWPPGPAAQGSAWLQSQRLQNIFPVGLPSQELLPLPTTVPTGPACLPSTLAFKYIQSRLLHSPLPTIESTREGAFESFSLPTPFPHNGHTVFISFCMWH